MKLIQSASEVGEAVNQAKASAAAFCTNFFPAPSRLQSWIEHGELIFEQGNGTALFLRKDRGFWHLYFSSATPASLRKAVIALPSLSTEPVVVDLVGQEAATDELAGLFEGTGFRRYQRLFRMARIVPTAIPPVVAGDPRVVRAGKEDVQPILDLLLRSFDSRAEQIPMPYEIEAALEAGQIWVGRCHGALAGLLFFETQGLTSTLRYWLVAPEFQAKRFGSALMQRYFADHPAVRRFLLWVVADNSGAIAKYEHYGFVPDGLVDHVLANEVIRP